jgi:hypothetical protein
MRGVVGRNVRHAVIAMTGTDGGAGKHTSVTKEASKAMVDLKNRRKAKDERALRRVSPPHSPCRRRVGLIRPRPPVENGDIAQVQLQQTDQPRTARSLISPRTAAARSHLRLVRCLTARRRSQRTQTSTLSLRIGTNSTRPD